METHPAEMLTLETFSPILHLTHSRQEAGIYNKITQLMKVVAGSNVP
jgi:hypothetical protein